jgi:flagellar biosynthesis GTPase FlhF
MSTALYDTAPHPAAPREGPPDPARQRSGRHRGRPDPAPGDFAPRIYRGRSVEELIPKIVSELGEDAVVIRHHRGLTGGFAGFFQRSFVEIEARRGAPGIDRYDEDDAAPVLPDEAAPAPEEWDEPMEVWATNPFAAALAEAEAAVRAAEPAVPPDLDAALAEALAEAEDAEAQDPEAAAAEDPEATAQDPEAAAAEDPEAPNPGSIAALAQLLAEVAPDRVVLALPATLGATPVAQLLQALRPLGANALAVIHADETDQLGVAVQAACAFESTPVYVLARADHSGADGGPRAWTLSSIDPCQLLDRLLPPR